MKDRIPSDSTLLARAERSNGLPPIPDSGSRKSASVIYTTQPNIIRRRPRAGSSSLSEDPLSTALDAIASGRALAKPRISDISDFTQKEQRSDSEPDEFAGMTVDRALKRALSRTSPAGSSPRAATGLAARGASFAARRGIYVPAIETHHPNVPPSASIRLSGSSSGGISYLAPTPESQLTPIIGRRTIPSRDGTLTHSEGPRFARHEFPSLEEFIIQFNRHAALPKLVFTEVGFFGKLSTLFSTFNSRAKSYLLWSFLASSAVSVGLSMLKIHNNGFKTAAVEALRGGELAEFQRFKAISTFFDQLDLLIIWSMLRAQTYIKCKVMGENYNHLQGFNRDIIGVLPSHDRRNLYIEDLPNISRSLMTIIHKGCFGVFALLQSCGSLSYILSTVSGMNFITSFAIVSISLGAYFYLTQEISLLANNAGIEEREVIIRQQDLTRTLMSLSPDLDPSPQSIEQIKTLKETYMVGAKNIIHMRDSQERNRTVSLEWAGAIFWSFLEVGMVLLINPQEPQSMMNYLVSISVLNEMLRRLVRSGFDCGDAIGTTRRLLNNDMKTLRFVDHVNKVIKENPDRMKSFTAQLAPKSNSERSDAMLYL